jgi:hypothetical protein
MLRLCNDRNRFFPFEAKNLRIHQKKFFAPNAPVQPSSGARVTAGQRTTELANMHENTVIYLPNAVDKNSW